jgi:hypothetical protein
MESNAPYVLLGILYAYLLYLSWNPETLKCMFASKYWLPEVGKLIFDLIFSIIDSCDIMIWKTYM